MAGCARLSRNRLEDGGCHNVVRHLLEFPALTKLECGVGIGDLDRTMAICP